jgi:hypothetical protein
MDGRSWKTLTAGNQPLSAKHQEKNTNPENKLTGKPNRLILF